MIQKADYLVVLIFILSVCCLNSCLDEKKRVRPIEKEGRLYGVTEDAFRHRWWDYYERGVSFGDGGLWSQAEADLREAMKKAGTDQRDAETYNGRMTDYFPHRELGAVLFHQGRYLEAIQELEASLLSETSARAEYYLDRARLFLIDEKNSDLTPPAIFIETPEKGSVSNQLSIHVSGVVRDDTYVKEITVNTKPIRIDHADRRIRFNTEISLEPGENIFIIQARDLTGKTASAAGSLFCDRSGPVLNIDRLIPEDHSDKYRLIGYAHDHSDIKTISVNGLNILKSVGPEVILNHQIRLSDQEKVIVVAEDQAGNQTIAEISPLNAPDISPLVSPDISPLVIKPDISPGQKKPDKFPLKDVKSDPREKPLLKKDAKPDTSALERKKSDKSSEKQAKETDASEKGTGKHHLSGNYYALIIGIDKYDEWPRLMDAVRDAKALRNILIRRYGFPARNILLRTDKDARWRTLIEDLNYMAAGLGERDNLLIYFSGHGQMDRISGTGYWIPSDGKLHDPTTWITNSAIQNILSSPNVRGKNILIIADSCYSKALLQTSEYAASYHPGIKKDASVPREPVAAKGNEPESVKKSPRDRKDDPAPGKSEPKPGSVKKSPLKQAGDRKEPPESAKRKPGDRKERPGPIGKPESKRRKLKSLEEKLLKSGAKKSRQVISAWGTKPIRSKEKKHGLLTFQLIKALKKNTRKITDIEYLFHTCMRRQMIKRGGQNPVMGRLITDADKGGQFLLFLTPESPESKDPEKIPERTLLSEKQGMFPGPVVTPWDTVPPVIEEKKGWDQKNCTVFTDHAFLRFYVYDDSGIQKFSVNGQKIPDRPGQNLHLNYMTPLIPGENKFLIECLDQVGNKAEQNILIHRRISQVYETGSRMSAILFMGPMKRAHEEVKIGNKPVKSLVRGIFLESLERSQRFNLIEIPDHLEPEDLYDITDVAKKIEAEFVIKADIIAKNNSVQISVSVIEAGYSKVVTYQDVYAENPDKNIVEKLCRELAVKLEGALPIAEGRIVKIRDEKNIIIDLGESDKIRTGMRVIFFQEDPLRDPVTGENLGAEKQYLGEARVQKVMLKQSVSELLDPNIIIRLEEGQGVVMK